MIYIELFHGREDKDQEMDELGFVGPTFGPYSHIQSTYGCHLRLFKEDYSEDQLFYVEDMVYYDGCYYGDFWVGAKPAYEPVEFSYERTRRPSKEANP